MNHPVAQAFRLGLPVSGGPAASALRAPARLAEAKRRREGPHPHVQSIARFVDAESPLAGLRVAYLIESDGPGGAERVVADLAKSVQALGGQSVVFVPAEGEGWLANEVA